MGSHLSAGRVTIGHMPGYTRWYNKEKTVIIHEIIGHWGVDAVLDEMHAAAGVLETDRYRPRYFIFDLTHAKGIPAGILSRRNRYEETIDPDSVTILVGADGVIEFFVKAMDRMGFKSNTLFVDSLESAEKLIQQYQNSEI